MACRVPCSGNMSNFFPYVKDIRGDSRKFFKRSYIRLSVFREFRVRIARNLVAETEITRTLRAFVVVLKIATSQAFSGDRNFHNASCIFVMLLKGNLTSEICW